MQWLPSQGVGVRLEVERYLAIGTAFAAGQTGGTGEANVDAAWLSVLARF